MRIGNYESRVERILIALEENIAILQNIRAAFEEKDENSLEFGSTFL